MARKFEVDVYGCLCKHDFNGIWSKDFYWTAPVLCYGGDHPVKKSLQEFLDGTVASSRVSSERAVLDALDVISRNMQEQIERWCSENESYASSKLLQDIAVDWTMVESSLSFYTLKHFIGKRVTKTLKVDSEFRKVWKALVSKSEQAHKDGQYYFHDYGELRNGVFGPWYESIVLGYPENIGIVSSNVSDEVFVTLRAAFNDLIFDTAVERAMKKRK